MTSSGLLCVQCLHDPVNMEGRCEQHREMGVEVGEGQGSGLGQGSELGNGEGANEEEVDIKQGRVEDDYDLYEELGR